MVNSVMRNQDSSSNYSCSYNDEYDQQHQQVIPPGSVG